MNKRNYFYITSIFAIALMFCAFLHINTAYSQDRNEFKLRKEVVTYIPYNDLQKLLQSNKKMIYMPYEELKKLIEAKSKLRPPAPVNYAINDISLVGTVNKDSVSFDANYKITILNKEWAKIPVLLSQVGLKSAIWDKKPAPLNFENENFNLLSDTVGEHNLNLKFDVKITDSGTSKSFNVKLPDFPVIKLALEVSEKDMKLNILNASGLRTENKNGHTVIYTNLNSNGDISVDWKTSPIKTAKPELAKIKIKEDNRPSKIITDAQTLISVDEGIMHGYTTYNCQVYHKPVDKINLAIPDDINILSVSSSNNIIRKTPYEISKPDRNKQGKILTVYFNTKISDNAIFSVSFEKNFNDKNTVVEIPDLSPTGKEINKVLGYIAVQSLGNIEVKLSESSNITRVDLKDLPAQLISSAMNPVLLSYNFINGAYKLKLNIIPHKDAPVQVAVIDNAVIDSRLSPNGVNVTNAEYNIRNKSEQYLKFNLPKNAEILIGTINNVPQQIETEKDKITKKNTYFINIKNYQGEQPFKFAVMYKEDLKFNLLNKLIFINRIAAPEILNMPIMTLNWDAWEPKNMQYWNVTDLKQGYNDYYSYISGNSYSSNKSGFDQNMPAQVSNLSPEGPLVSDDKAVGVLPPKFSMPPVTGLVNFKFSDYLLNQNAPYILNISIANFIVLIIFFGVLFAIWKNKTKIYEYIKEIKSKF